MSPRDISYILHIFPKSEFKASKATVQPPTKVTAEFAHHSIWIGCGNLGESSQDENITVFKRSLVHGLKGKFEKNHLCNKWAVLSILTSGSLEGKEKDRNTINK